MVGNETMRRRSFLALAGAALFCSRELIGAGRAKSPPVTLLSAPVEMVGEWGGSPPQAALRVVARMREVALSGLRLFSDQQPQRLRVDNHASGPPAVWLHDDPPQTAWVIVDIGPADWCKLAYQFGHELGHVLCNSWGRLAVPLPPSQWLEEALVEAFSIRGLGLLAASWEANPPFAGDAPFAKFIRQYRQDLIDNYRNAPTPETDFAAWFQTYRSPLEAGIGEPEGPAVLAMLAEEEKDKACVEDLGAVNRWPARSAVPVEEYLTLWEASCAAIGTSGHLPARLRSLLQLA
jgi:hypothetical protein